MDKVLLLGARLLATDSVKSLVIRLLEILVARTPSDVDDKVLEVVKELLYGTQVKK